VIPKGEYGGGDVTVWDCGTWEPSGTGPYLAGRPVNANRFPDGIARPGIWHKEIPDYAPEWITRWHNVEADPGETECYAVLDSALTS
jgi:DNA primase